MPNKNGGGPDYFETVYLHSLHLPLSMFALVEMNDLSDQRSNSDARVGRSMMVVASFMSWYCQ